MEIDEEERQLERVLFGGKDEFTEELWITAKDLQQSSDRVNGEKQLTATKNENLFVLDPTGDSLLAVNRQFESDEDVEEGVRSRIRGVWTDSDDEKIGLSLATKSKYRKLRMNESEDVVSGKLYQMRSRQYYERLHPRPDWASVQNASHFKRPRRSSDHTSNDSDHIEGNGDFIPDPLEHLLQQSDVYSCESAKSRYSDSKINISRLRDVTRQVQSQSAIQTMQFHPKKPFLLTGGYDRTLRLYHVDGKINPLATSVRFQPSTIQTALFNPDGLRVYAGGRRRYYYVWNVETGAVEKISRIYGHDDTQRSMEKFIISSDGKYLCFLGKDGWINILSADSGQWITGVKVDGQVVDVKWWPEDGGFTAINYAGEVWDWSFRTRTFSNRWTDEGGISLSKLAMSNAGSKRLCAIGSKCGIVNVYDREKVEKSSENLAVKPIKTLGQLVTSIHALEFSQDGQILATSSRSKKDQLRLIHTESMKAYKNWPTSDTPLGRIGAIAFSPTSDFLTVGNEKGKITLYQMRP